MESELRRWQHTSSRLHRVIEIAVLGNDAQMELKFFQSSFTSFLYVRVPQKGYLGHEASMVTHGSILKSV